MCDPESVGPTHPVDRSTYADCPLYERYVVGLVFGTKMGYYLMGCSFEGHEPKGALSKAVIIRRDVLDAVHHKGCSFTCQNPTSGHGMLPPQNVSNGMFKFVSAADSSSTLLARYRVHIAD